MRYVVTAIVEAERLGELITAATPMLAAPIQVAPEVVPEPVRQRRERNDLPAHRTRCGATALEALRTGPCTLLEISSHLEKAGFSQNSSSPILSKLISERLVVRGSTSLNGVPTKIYTLTEAGAALEARKA